MMCVRQQGSLPKWRIALFLLGIGLLAIASMAVVYWYTQVNRPPELVVATVNDVHLSQDDMIERMRMAQAGQGHTDASLDLSSILRVLYNPEIDINSGPFNLGWVQMEILKQFGPEYGVTITDDDIEEIIRADFTPGPTTGEVISEDQQEREYKERYASYLKLNGISDADFRRLSEERLYFNGMREAIGASVPTEAEHLDVYWLRTPIRPAPTLGDPAKYQDLQLIAYRLEEEEFEAVASEYSLVFDQRYTEPNGYVGWLPRGAFPELEPVLYGAEFRNREIEGLEIGEISEPWESGGYMYFMKVVDGPEVREVESKWTERFKDIALQTWLETKFEEGIREGWVRMNYERMNYAWPVELLHQTDASDRRDR